MLGDSVTQITVTYLLTKNLMEQEGTFSQVREVDAVFRKLKGKVFWAVGLLMLRKFCIAHPGYFAQRNITKLKLPDCKLSYGLGLFFSLFFFFGWVLEEVN